MIISEIEMVARLLLALVLRSARLIREPGHLVLVAAPWPIAILLFQLLAPDFGVMILATGLIGGLATFSALHRAGCRAQDPRLAAAAE